MNEIERERPKQSSCRYIQHDDLKQPLQAYTKPLLKKRSFWIAFGVGSFTLLSFVSYQLIVGGFNPNKTFHIAFIGNSIQYYNDFPRLMEAISGFHIIQCSCLRGGASFKTILSKGNGMYSKWATSNALQEDGTFDIGAPSVYDLMLGDYSQDWDFVVMNDRTYYPASNRTLKRGKKVLKKTYVPMILTTGATPVFLANHANRNVTHHSRPFGDFENFTHLILQGYQEYKNFIDYYLPQNQSAKIAPVGKAFLKVYEEDASLWYKLYHWDGLHPSPHGSFLQACVVYCTIYNHPPPKKYALPRTPSSLFNRARVMQPKDMPPLDRPTLGEAMYLYDVAKKVALTDYRVVTSYGWE